MGVILICFIFNNFVLHISYLNNLLLFVVIGLVCFGIFFITSYFISLIEELRKLDIPSYFASTQGELYLLGRVRGRFVRNRTEFGKL